MRLPFQIFLMERNTVWPEEGIAQTAAKGGTERETEGIPSDASPL